MDAIFKLVVDGHVDVCNFGKARLGGELAVTIGRLVGEDLRLKEAEDVLRFVNLLEKTNGVRTVS